jgi:hypothetical protein
MGGFWSMNARQSNEMRAIGTAQYETVSARDRCRTFRLLWPSYMKDIPPERAANQRR